MQKKVGKVLNLFVYDAQTQNRVSQNSIQLDKGGVIGDKHYGKDALRSVLLISEDSYTLARENDIMVLRGNLGENILIDYNPYNLPIGAKLQIGGVILEISQNGTLCNGLSKIDKSLPKLLKNNRGIFARVIEAGEISTKADLYLL
jgi:MOSC domain-containing protein YiiM